MKQIILFSIALVFCLSTYSQEKTISEITSFKIKNSGSMLDINKNVDGYYFFYEADKLEKGKREFSIKLLDNNLNEVANKSYIDDKRTILAQSKFNNQALMFVMYNEKERFFKLVGFDRSGNSIKEIEIPISKKERRWVKMMANSNNFNMLLPVDNKGFIFNSIVDNKKIGYNLKYVATDGGNSWDYGSDEESKDIFMVSPIQANEKIIVALESVKSSLLSQKIDNRIIVLDTDTGKLLFSKNFDKKENPRFVTNAFLTKDNELVLLGEYFKKNDNIYKDKSLGMFSQVLDISGNEITDNLVSWEEEINDMLPKDDKGNIERGYIYFHDIIRTQKGTFYAIGEQYKKTISLGGTALALLSRSTSGFTQLTITDALLFEFDENFKLSNVKVVEKGKSRAPNLIDVGSPQLNAHILKNYGAFDYEFTQIDPDRDRFYAAFIDYERIKGEKNKTAFKAVIYDDGQIKEDKIYLEDEGKNIDMRIMPAKIGNILILEYNRKEKKVLLHIENLNIN